MTDDCGNTTTHDQVITVKDNTPPVITNVSATPNVLWPANHKMRNVTINYAAVDNCSPVTNVLSVTSNEPVNGTGDGDTDPDWIVIDDHHVKLRAERAGNGNGRVYTVTITSTDDCGNVSSTTTTISVPHDMRNTDAVVNEPVNEIIKGFTVKASPNPSVNSFVIAVNSDNKQDRIFISVFDMFGRKVEDRILNNEAILMIGEKYLPGTYIVRVMQGQERRDIKLVKLN